MGIFASLAGSLLLTLALELAFALLWRVERRDLAVVALANVLTNPAVVLCAHVAAMYAPGLRAWAVAALELGAAAAEALVYRRRSRIVRPLLFSLCANAFSYFAGLIF